MCVSLGFGDFQPVPRSKIPCKFQFRQDPSSSVPSKSHAGLEAKQYLESDIIHQHSLLTFTSGYFQIASLIYLSNRSQSQPVCKSCGPFIILGLFIWLPPLNRGTPKLPNAKARTVCTRSTLCRRSCCHHKGELLSDSTRVSPQAQANCTKTSPSSVVHPLFGN